jgi:hypothetical protein
MKIRLLTRLLMGSLIIAAANAAWADDSSMLNRKDLKWGDAPPALPKGAKLTVLYGDPFKPGPYALRAMFPPGYVVPPHFHTKDENLTVLSGALHLGMGEKIDKKGAHVLNLHGFHHLVGGTHHYAFVTTATVLEIHGDGPFDINYINPADDPQTKKK